MIWNTAAANSLIVWNQDSVGELEILQEDIQFAFFQEIGEQAESAFVRERERVT